MAGTFNPFELDKPTLNLGDHGEFTLGDITESRRGKLVEIGERIDALDPDADDAEKAYVDAVCDLVDAACEKPGAGIVIREAWAAEVIGAKALAGLVGFVMDWLAGNDAAGEA